MLSVKFDILSVATLITGEAEKQIKVYQIHMSDNSGALNRVRLASLTPTKDYYGGAQGSIYLMPDGHFQLLFREAHRIPYIVVDTGKSLVLDSVGRVSGEVLYEIE
jgi:hypothetical protein